MPRVPVVSINVGNLSPQKHRNFGRKAEIAVRSGFTLLSFGYETPRHFGSGTVRFSFGYHNTEEEVDTALDVLDHMRHIL